MLSKYFKNPKDRTDFFISIAVIVFAGLFIGYYSFSSSEPFIAHYDEQKISNPKVESLELEGRMFVAVKSEESSYQKSIKRGNNAISEVQLLNESDQNTEIVTPEIKKESQASDENIDEADFNDKIEDIDEIEISDTDDIDSEELDEEVEDVHRNLDEIDLEPKDAIDESDKDVVETEIGDVSEKETAETKEDEVVQSEKRVNQPKNRDCIIVIGAFGNKRNIKKLIGKLDYQGYPIFKVPFNGLTRVGIYENCDKAEETLTKIKSKYSPDAFIMKAR